MNFFFRNWANRLLLPLLLAVLCNLFNSALAQTSPEVSRGLAWLNSQVQGDGSLSNENAALATPLQTRAEVAQTLKQLASLPAPLITGVLNKGEDNTEYLARKVLALSGSNTDISASISTLLQRQNSDGGFAPAPGYASDPLDTAWALLALATVKQANPQGIDLALSYLLQSKQADGGWGVVEQTRVWISSLVLLSANQWKSNYPVDALSTAAHDWLLARASNGVFDGVSNNALALLALATHSSSGLQPLQDALKAAQQSDGSWGGDPFATALALRALGASTGAGSGSASTGDVTGRVVVASTGNGLADTTIQIVELPAFGATTDSSGAFALRGLNPGQYTLRASKLAYGTRQLNITITGGQTLTISPISMTAASLGATISGVVRDKNGSVLDGVLIAVGTSSGSSNAQGAYQLTGLNPGAVTILASKANYQSVNVNVSLTAGSSYTFSPTLYDANTTPPATSIKGKVLEAGSNKALAGVSIKINQTLVASALDGSFVLDNQSSGAFSLGLNANGYQGLTISGTLAAGLNDLGTVTLSKLETSSTISGVVSDADSGSVLAGAVVSVVGSNLSATSDASGAYQISGVNVRNFALRATAAGYLNGNLNVVLPQTGAATVNLKLLKTQASGISFISIKPNKTAYAPSDTLELDVVVKNSGNAAANLILDAQVRDAQGKVVLVLQGNAKGLGENPPNLPLVFAAASNTSVELEKFLIRQGAGNYSISVYAYDGNGVVVAEGTTQISVLSQATLAGAIVLDPPLVHAGTNTPVKLTAQLSNSGNLPIDPGSANLTVTLDRADPGNAQSAQFKIKTLSSDDLLRDGRGLATDASGNRYTVDYSADRVYVVKIDPQGTQSIYANLRNPGLFHYSAIVFDKQGRLWLANEGPATVVRADSQGIVEKIAISALSKIYGIDFDDTGNILLVGEGDNEDRLVRRTVQGQESVLWRNGFYNAKGVTKDAQGNLVVSNHGDGTLVKVSPTGLITPFISGLSHPMGLAVDGVGNIYVANNGENNIIKVAPDGSKSVYATGLLGPADLKFDANGVLFVSVPAENSLYRVTGQNQVELFVRALADGPQGMKYDAAGKLYIANDDGTVRTKDPANNVSILATGLKGPRGLDIAPNGDVFVANNTDGTIARISGTSKSTFASGLKSPFGVAIDSASNVYVTEQSQPRIRQYDSSGNLVSQVDNPISSLSMMRVSSDGKLYLMNQVFISVIDGGTTRVFASDIALRSIIPDPVQGGLIGLGNDLSTIYRINANGEKRTIKTIPANLTSTLALDAQGNIFFVDYYAKKLKKIDSSGNVFVVSDIPDAIDGIISDFNGNLYVWRNNPGLLLKVDANGNTLPFFSTGEAVSNVNISFDGRPMLWTNASKLYVLNKVTGVPEVHPVSFFNVQTATIDGNNNLYANYKNSNSINIFNSSGQEINRIDGFDSPKDIIWTGTELRFINRNGLYRMAPGGYPKLINNGNFPTDYLMQRGNDFYGARYSSIYKWTESGVSDLTSFAGASVNGIAGNRDGSITVGDSNANRVITVDSSNRIISDFPSLKLPLGLAFDAQGKLYVANSITNGSVTRIDTVSRSVATFATIAYPNFLSFDPAGNLWSSTNNDVVKFSPQGAPQSVPGNTAAQGIFADSTGVYAINYAMGQLRQLQGTTWSVLAAGLAAPKAVHVLADGSVNVANSGNGTVVKWANGKLDVLSGGLAAPHAFWHTSDGKIIVGGNSSLAQIGSDGTLTHYDIQRLLEPKLIRGLIQQSDGSLIALANASNTSSLLQLTMSPAVSAPAAGTVVYQSSVAAAGLAPGGPGLALDFGNWTPPYSGDFKFEISYPNGVGTVQNFLHAGPLARGVLATSTPVVGPGTQKVPMTLTLTGADFTSFSRVETALVRRLLPVPQPKGMTSDREGNLWHSDGSGLNKTTPNGETIRVVTGMVPNPGLAIDSSQRLYLTNGYNNVNNLVQIMPDGRTKVLAYLGGYGTGAAGVAVNSQDEVLLAVTGKLLKYSLVTNLLTTVSAVGIERPRGIAIDGRDNVYVQNENNLVSIIKPDGSTTILYSKGDGVDEPVFEGDGQPTIAGDCAENFYIAPYTWKKVNKDTGEESMLAQIIPRTGQATALLNGLQIDSKLSDIDYLSFDRFNNRILMWNDFGNPADVWQVPVTCGAISVDAHLLSKPGQTLSGFSRAPNATINLNDGRTEYVWSLRDVSSQAIAITFDTLLANLALGEQRPTLESAFLQFKNSFSPTDVKVPMTIPFVAVGNQINLQVASDKPEYSANQNAQLATTLNNPNLGSIGGQLQVNVYDEKNALVASVTQQDVRLDAKTDSTIKGLLDTGKIAPGNYKVLATLSSNGALQASSSTNITILADQAQASAVSSLSVDKQQYTPGQTVTISSRAVNQSANLTLSGLSLSIKLFDPANQLLFSKTNQIAQLTPALATSFSATWPLNNAVPGSYRVSQTLNDVQGREYDNHSVNFTVASSSETGSGLTGTLKASPKEVHVGEVVSIAISSSNNGNSALNNLPLTMRIVDPVSQTVLSESNYTPTLGIGASFTQTINWGVSGNPPVLGSQYVAVLLAQIGANSLTLAQDNFKVLPGVVQSSLEVQQQTVGWQNVLVFSRCKRVLEELLGRCGAVTLPLEDPLQLAQCDLERGNALDQYLSSAGITHKVTSSASEFLQGIRNGGYNTFWVSNGATS
ncbi:MAG: hypothetical protein RL748_2819, partial [Pseudomonadota bacterium]